MAAIDESLFTTSGRLASFQSEHRLEKRRASNQKKKQTNTISWPHEVPTPEELSRAGFYYKPSSDSDDNVACFLCHVKLDGWEVGDIALDEHLAHAKTCGWAVSLSCARENEDRDPMDEDLVDARTATYADLWPHEKKKAWKPKVKKLVEAGWCFDPSQEAEDGTTCFYCNLSLDGWEPKDNPMDEHRRRSPDCVFFALLDHYKALRPKGKRGRASTASKASRLSTQSMQSTFSEAPSLMSLGDAGLQTDMDESMAVDTTITSDAGTTKGRKKAAKSKLTGKGRKKAVLKEESVDLSVPYPDIDEPAPEPAVVEPEVNMEEEAFIEELPVEMEPEIQPEPEVEEEFEPEPEPEPLQKPVEPTRGRKLKRADESQIEDPSVMEIEPPSKPAKKGKTKSKKVPQTPLRVSEDESQLQSELQEAASFASALQSPPPQATKGVKRTSDGHEKVEVVIHQTVEEAPAKPKKARRTAKPKKGKKTAKDEQEDTDMLSATVDESTDIATSQPEVKPKRGRKPKKVQEPEPEPEPEPAPEVVEPEIEEAPQAVEPEVETPELVEPEIVESEIVEPEAIEPEIEEEPELEPELEADDEDQAVFETPRDAHDHLPTPAEEEFEPTPTPQKPRASSRQIPSSVRQPTPRTARTTQSALDSGASSPQSVQSSDAENHRPSSSSMREAPSTIKKAPRASDFPLPPASANRTAAFQPREAFASPGKTTRIALAPGTPNRSPIRGTQRSPSKTLGQLSSTTPWVPVDLETVFFLSPEKENADSRDLGEKLADVGGLLTSPEKKMSVEEWVRWRAEQGEQNLRSECERLVGLFEKEGGKAQEALFGIKTTS
ncbi:hypothetical protein BDV97DRAFT_369169 [Delphinella strobiligena]|nr:hypothetical protein BDV97DRAFT_369169 [Delphinella strobiligena]